MGDINFKISFFVTATLLVPTKMTDNKLTNDSMNTVQNCSCPVHCWHYRKVTTVHVRMYFAMLIWVRGGGLLNCYHKRIADLHAKRSYEERHHVALHLEGETSVRSMWAGCCSTEAVSTHRTTKLLSLHWPACVVS